MIHYIHTDGNINYDFIFRICSNFYITDTAENILENGSTHREAANPRAARYKAERKFPTDIKRETMTRNDYVEWQTSARVSPSRN